MAEIAFADAFADAFMDGCPPLKCETAL